MMKVKKFLARIAFQILIGPEKVSSAMKAAITVAPLAKKVNHNYALEMSGGDDEQFQTLVNLGDQADAIIELCEFFQLIWSSNK